MTTTLPTQYTNGGVDRADRLRSDAAWLAARMDDPATRVVPTWRLQVLATGEDSPSAAFVSPASTRGHEGPDGYVLLGVADEVAYFAVDVSQLDDPASTLGIPEDSSFAELRRVGPLL